MTKIAMALAAASMLAAPAAVAQNGNAYGQGPRVCLVTFQDGGAAGTPASDVTKAQYVPLAIALKLQAKDTTDIQQILTYGPTGYAGPEVYPGGARLNASGFDIPNTLTANSTTEEACAVLADYADSRDDDDDA